jgi:hypothetical protein
MGSIVYNKMVVEHAHLLNAYNLYFGGVDKGVNLFASCRRLRTDQHPASFAVYNMDTTKYIPAPYDHRSSYSLKELYLNSIMIVFQEILNILSIGKL